MYTRLTAFAVWALLAGSVVFWLLKLAVSPLPAPAQGLVALDGMPSRVDLSRLLGATPVGEALEAPVTAESRFQLVGVAAPKAGMGAGEGVALIAVEGLPPRPYRVGAVVDADLLLLSVTSRSAELGPKGKDKSPSLVLQLQPPGIAVNAPIVSGAGAGNAAGLQGIPANIAPVKLTLGLNPVPATPDSAQMVSPAEPLRGSAQSGELTR